MTSILLCTDLDRTLIPNGTQPEHPMARPLFRELCELPEISLAYVTGRHLELMQSAIKNFQLPQPNYAITDVGTKIYHRDYQDWHPMRVWENEIDQGWSEQNLEQIQTSLRKISGLRLQEPSKQNTHKISFYADLQRQDSSDYLSQTKECLDRFGLTHSLIWSIDETIDLGLLDILPPNATKLHAIEFLRDYLNFPYQATVFSGDSGNDLPVLISPIQSILVANATDELKFQAYSEAQQNGNQLQFFQAENTHHSNGNYAAGILQGVEHYFPHIKERLHDWDKLYD
ncbi:HAD-IIB family hydrolase [Thiomicrorhabdus xiamenensis]|uniref:HAD-IIB family hydrolase n=1 Tax=Thiomicrorhabdus xiamenensis TaxID=2739063 RepID=A0A7D4TEK7_9GAMM|nr:HAD-IIB family hydrolase [Thiomicrorhabdus xiamenensis]QKI89507.1 HAD-IIB family hydrolase [Thiomicrorhabdus xiamenensis]